MRASLSLRGDYAVRAMLALGALGALGAAPGATDDAEPVAARRIAERARIPSRFVAHVMSDLGRAGLVVGTTGRRGGYRLAAPAAEISLLSIVDAVEERGVPPRCVLRGGLCDASGRCAVHDAFYAATDALRASLRRTTLAELVARDLEIEAPR
ncbi:MAG TPA: Rrf2 family transcriptional regulator [Candidatus Limnocylindrales bacterium]